MASVHGAATIEQHLAPSRFTGPTLSSAVASLRHSIRTSITAGSNSNARGCKRGQTPTVRVSCPAGPPLSLDAAGASDGSSHACRGGCCTRVPSHSSPRGLGLGLRPARLGRRPLSSPPAAASGQKAPSNGSPSTRGGDEQSGGAQDWWEQALRDARGRPADEQHQGAGNSASRQQQGHQQQQQEEQQQWWQVQLRRARAAVVGAVQALGAKKAQWAGGVGAPGQTPELRTLISDVRRMGLSGVMLGVISLLHLYAHGRLGPAADTALDTLSLFWFLFMALDLALTGSTWVVGAKSLDLLMATCPSCGNVFYYSRDCFQGFMACPKCFQEMRWDNGRFVRDRPRFSRVDFGHDIFGDEPDEPPAPKRKFLPIVDVDATVTDK